MARGFSFFDEALVSFWVIGPDCKTTQRLQQLFRVQFSATVSSMMRKKELPPRFHWIIFSKGLNSDRIKFSKEPEPVPSTSGVLALCLLLLMILQLYHLPPPLPSLVSNSSCLFTGCWPLYVSCCTGLLYFSSYCIIRLKMLYLCLFAFMYYLYEKYYKPITV